MYKKSSLFQRYAVWKWNPNYTYDTIHQLIVPKVMLHNKITTDGYGKCIIELSKLHGILDKYYSGDNMYEWRLSNKWQEKILCLDGLSLDRHYNFCNKLLKLPMSFTKAYQQNKILKAIDTCCGHFRPLHMTFHMLQNIFII